MLRRFKAMEPFVFAVRKTIRTTSLPACLPQDHHRRVKKIPHGFGPSESCPR